MRFSVFYLKEYVERIRVAARVPHARRGAQVLGAKGEAHWFSDAENNTGELSRDFKWGSPMFYDDIKGAVVSVRF